MNMPGGEPTNSDVMMCQSAHLPVAETDNQRQRHRMNNVGADDLYHRRLRVEQHQREDTDSDLINRERRSL